MPPMNPLATSGLLWPGYPIRFFRCLVAVSLHCPPLTSKILGPDHFWKRNYWCFPHQTMNNYPKWSCLAKKYHHFIVSHQNAGRHNSHVWIFMDIFSRETMFYSFLFHIFPWVLHRFVYCVPWFFSMVVHGLDWSFHVFFSVLFHGFPYILKALPHGAPLQLDIEFEIPSFTSQAPALAWAKKFIPAKFC